MSNEKVSEDLKDQKNQSEEKDIDKKVSELEDRIRRLERSIVSFKLSQKFKFILLCLIVILLYLYFSGIFSTLESFSF